MFPTMIPSSSLNVTSFLDFNAEGMVGILIKVLVGASLLAYIFFAFFLYLRVRILSITLSTPNAGAIRYLSLIHLLAVIGLAFMLGILLLF
jgi:hypothetical protein